MNKLEELALRCERATRGDYSLDVDIARAVKGFPATWPASYGNALVSSYSSSIDAAMTLVPEGWRMAALCEREPWFCRLETADFDSVTWGKGGDYITDIVAGQETTAKAATPALALAAASLRARSIKEGSHGEG